MVAMATREGLSFLFCFENIVYIFLRKMTRCQEKSFSRFGVMPQKPQGGGGGAS